MLYVGTTRPILRREWIKDAPDISVASLTEHDSAIKAHFRSAEVQCIGSTAGCGCDFPHVLLQNGEWPIFDFEDAERVATFGQNRRALATLLRNTGDNNNRDLRPVVGQLRQGAVVPRGHSLAQNP